MDCSMAPALGTAHLIAAFEEEQKTVVFAALSEYLHQALFTDVVLVVGHQRLRAHKVVLSSSCKFFRDAFKHHPGMTCIDLNKELAANDLSLTFEDVQQIICILYCVGTVDISPQKVASLRLIAQVMGIPSLIRFLKQIQESPMMTGSTTPGGQVVVPPPPPPPPPVPPSHLSHQLVSGAVGSNNSIVGLQSGGTSQPFTMEATGGSVSQESQQEISAGSTHILRQNLLQQNHSQGQTSVKSDPSRASFVYLLPPPDTTNSTFGHAAAAAAASAIAAANMNEGQQNITGPPQDLTNIYNQQPTNEPISNTQASSTLRLPIQLKMTASCMNTPAPPSNTSQPGPSNALDPSSNSTNPERSIMTLTSNDGERMVPNKQERIESCFGILGLRNDDQSRSGSRATLASLGSFTLQQPLNCSGVSPGSIMRMDQGVSSLAAQFSFVQGSSSSGGMTGISDMNSCSNPTQTGGGSNVLEGLDPATFLNQLNNLQANQIDDLESALLPHLHGGLTSTQTFDGNNTMQPISLGTYTPSLNSSNKGSRQSSTVRIKQQPQEQDESHEEITSLSYDDVETQAILPLGMEEDQSLANNQQPLAECMSPTFENNVTADDIASEHDTENSLNLSVDKSIKESKQNRARTKERNKDAQRSLLNNISAKNTKEKVSNNLNTSKSDQIFPGSAGSFDSQHMNDSRGDIRNAILSSEKSLHSLNSELSLRHNNIQQMSFATSQKKATSPNVSKNNESKAPFNYTTMPRITIAQLGGLSSKNPSLNISSEQTNSPKTRQSNTPLNEILSNTTQQSIMSVPNVSKSIKYSNTTDKSRLKMTTRDKSTNKGKGPKPIEAVKIQQLKSPSSDRLNTSTPKSSTKAHQNLPKLSRNKAQLEDINNSVNFSEPSSVDLNESYDQTNEDSNSQMEDTNEEVHPNSHNKIRKNASSDALSNSPSKKHLKINNKPMKITGSSTNLKDKMILPKQNPDIPTPSASKQEDNLGGGEEIKVALNSINEGQSFKFCIPGTSRSVTLNFSADALAKMRSSVTMDNSSVSNREDEILPTQNIDSSTPTKDTSMEEVSSSTNIDELGPHNKENDNIESIAAAVSEETVEDLPEREENQEPEILGENNDDNESGIPAQISSVLRSSKRMERGNKKHKKKKESQHGSDSPNCKAKGGFQCQLCSKQYPSKRLLEKHVVFHVDQNTACSLCGKIFLKRWMLEQHMAIDHKHKKEGSNSPGTRKEGKDSNETEKHNNPVECKECGKTFKWSRNLLAHVQLMHQREVRYRCKICPLTFLRRKSYIKHHKSKHSEAPETWCKFCLEIFENSKQRDDHTCDRIENTGQQTICHMHPEKGPMIFTTQEQLFSHFAKEHATPQNKQKVSNAETTYKHNLPNNQEDCERNDSLLESKNREAPLQDSNGNQDDKKHIIEGDIKLGTGSSSGYSGESRTKQDCSSRIVLATPPQLQHSCPVCHKKFLLKKNMVIHMKRYHDEHSEERGSTKGGPFPCSFCDKRFYYMKDCTQHENVHRGNKGFICTAMIKMPATQNPTKEGHDLDIDSNETDNNIDKKTTDENLVIDNTEESKPCGRSYSSAKALKDHIRTVHTDTNIYSCHICGKQLRDKYKLKYHMMVHTDKKHFKCCACPAQFKGRENLRKHVAKFHHELLLLKNSESNSLNNDSNEEKLNIEGCSTSKAEESTWKDDSTSKK